MVLFVVALVILCMRNLSIFFGTLISDIQCMYITRNEIHNIHRISKHEMPHEFEIFHILSQALIKNMD